MNAFLIKDGLFYTLLRAERPLINSYFSSLYFCLLIHISLSQEGPFLCPTLMAARKIVNICDILFEL